MIFTTQREFLLWSGMICSSTQSIAGNISDVSDKRVWNEQWTAWV